MESLLLLLREQSHESDRQGKGGRNLSFVQLRSRSSLPHLPRCTTKALRFLLKAPSLDFLFSAQIWHRCSTMLHQSPPLQGCLQIGRFLVHFNGKTGCIVKFSARSGDGITALPTFWYLTFRAANSAVLAFRRCQFVFSKNRIYSENCEYSFPKFSHRYVHNLI